MIDNIIYGLYCPVTDRLHYVGKSSTNLFRPLSHMSRSHSPKIREWVNELKELGLKPEIKILEEVEFIEHLSDREKYWIQKSITEGCYLLNVALNTAKNLMTEEVRSYTYIPHHPNPYKELANVVKYERAKAGLTVEQLAEYTDLTPGFIHETENGKERMIKLEKTIQLLDFFNLKIKYRGRSAYFEVTTSDF